MACCSHYVDIEQSEKISVINATERYENKTKAIFSAFKATWFLQASTFLGLKIGANFVILHEQLWIKWIQEAFGAQKFPISSLYPTHRPLRT